MQPHLTRLQKRPVLSAEDLLAVHEALDALAPGHDPEGDPAADGRRLEDGLDDLFPARRLAHQREPGAVVVALGVPLELIEGDVAVVALAPGAEHEPGRRLGSEELHLHRELEVPCAESSTVDQRARPLALAEELAFFETPLALLDLPLALVEDRLVRPRPGLVTTAAAAQTSHPPACMAWSVREAPGPDPDAGGEDGGEALEDEGAPARVHGVRRGGRRFQAQGLARRRPPRTGRSRRSGAG